MSAVLQAVDIDGNFHEVSPDSISWKVHAYGIVLDGDNILVSPQHGGRYDLPGGKVEIGESLEDGLVREVEEETGITARIVKQVTTRDVLFKITFREPQEVWHSVMVYYLCEKAAGEISTNGFDEHETQYAEEARWVSISELLEAPVASSVDFRPIVREALEDIHA